MMTRILAIFFSLCLTAVACAQSTITLRPAAKVGESSSITLGDVADLTGEDATRFATTVIVAATQSKPLAKGSVKVDIALVRAALKGTDIKWGKVSLSGSTCEVSVVSADAPKPALAPLPKAGVSVRDHVATRLAQHFGVEVRDLKLAYDADRSGILDVPTTGRTVAATPTGRSERMPLTIRVYEGTRLVAEGSIRVGVQVRRSVLVTRGMVSRGMRITSSDVLEEDRWISPLSEVAHASAVVGAAAKSRLDPGTVILARDVETPAVVRKGDLIAVDSVVGGVVIRMNNARALADGREGEEIVVEQAASLTAMDKARGKRGVPVTVRVTITGPGRAVVAGGQQ